MGCGLEVGWFWFSDEVRACFSNGEHAGRPLIGVIALA